MLLYNFIISLYWLVGRIYARFNAKADLWYNGHKNQKASNIGLAQKKRMRIWFHISSLGEYEQAKPILSRLAKDYEIILTFFSPSGFMAKNVREFTKYVFYLGKDSKQNALKNIAAILPDCLILVKYDFWLNNIIAAQKAQIPVLLISGIFRKNQIFFKFYGGVFRNALRNFKHIFLQNDESAGLLAEIGIRNTTVIGDTRVDSVVDNAPIAQEQLPKNIINFAKGQKCLVLGSSYLPEEEIINEQLSDCLKNWKILLAPHSLSEKHLNEIKSIFGQKAMFLSETTTTKPETQVLVIDQIGLLKYLYILADVAFVGGGFGKTVHNTLEPAAFGIPILFGPKFKKFPEAAELVKKGGAYSIKSKSDFKKSFEAIIEPDTYLKTSNIVSDYIFINQNATNKFLSYFNAMRLND